MDWHFDKAQVQGLWPSWVEDEELLDLKDVVVMPTLSTVTYLTSRRPCGGF